MGIRLTLAAISLTSVAGIHGQAGSPAVTPPSSAELRRDLARLGLDRRDSEAGWLVRAANELIKLGTARAIGVLRAAASGHPHDNRLFWLVRLVFEPPRRTGYFPLPNIGAFDPAPPSDLSKCPLFPIILVSDVPVNVFGGTRLAGFPETTTMYLSDLIPSGLRVRSHLYRPADDPFASADYALRTWNHDASWKLLDDAYKAGILQYVLCDFVGPALGPRSDRLDPNLKLSDLSARLRARGLRWDPKTESYQPSNGLGR